MQEDKYPEIVRAIADKQKLSFKPLWRMKDLDKVDDIEQQLQFVEATFYSRDEPELDKFGLKVS